MENQSRPLLPAPLRPVEPQISTPIPKRQTVAVACNNCRIKKVACDGGRPCTRCSRFGSPCIYNPGKASQNIALKSQIDSLQRELRDHGDILDKLRSSSDEDALQIINQLRRSSNMSMVLASAKGSASTLNRPSEIEYTRSLLPTTKSRLAFELTLQHNMVYAILEPLDVSMIDIAKLIKAAPRSSMEISVPIASQSDAALPNLGDDLHSAWILDPGEASFLPEVPHVFGYCDERLKHINIGYWSISPITNELAARAISMYLVNDHPILGFFDADLFLDDIVNGKLDFCCPFLVCSLLYLSCQSYTSVELQVFRLTEPLFQESERLWKSERSSDSPLTVASMMVFAYACTMSGKESLAFTLLREVRDMAFRLRMFGTPPSDQLVDDFRQLTVQNLRSMSHVAWGAYNWLSTHAMSFMEDPINYPPVLPIPGNSVSDSLMQNWPTHPLPGYMGRTFTFTCKYCVIVQEVAAVYLADTNIGLHQRVSLALAECKFQQMLRWADSLPEDMAIGSSSPPHVLLLHGLFHGMILDIFRPFTSRESSDQRLRSFNSFDSATSTLSTASCNQLKRVVYLYMSQLQPTLYSPVFSTPILQLVHCLLRSPNITDWRFYFFLCIHWLKIMTIRYPIFTTVARAHLTMAMKDSMISSVEAYQLMDEVKQSGQHHDGALDEAMLTCIVDFDLAMTDPEDAKVNTVAQRYEELAIFDTFIEGQFSGMREPSQEQK